MLYFAILGIVNAISFPLAALALWIQNEKFSFKVIPLSYARTTKTKNQFITYFIIGTIMEALFITSLFYSFSVLQSVVLYTVTVLGLSASIGIGVTTSPTTQTLHRLLAIAMVCTMIFWSFAFHTLLYVTAPLQSLMGFLLSSIALLVVPYLYFKLKSTGYTELFFLCIISLWNILMVSLLF